MTPQHFCPLRLWHPNHLIANSAFYGKSTQPQQFTAWFSYMGIVFELTSMQPTIVQTSIEFLWERHACKSESNALPWGTQPPCKASWNSMMQSQLEDSFPRELKFGLRAICNIFPLLGSHSKYSRIIVGFVTHKLCFPRFWNCSGSMYLSWLTYTPSKYRKRWGLTNSHALRGVVTTCSYFTALGRLDRCLCMSRQRPNLSLFAWLPSNACVSKLNEIQ